MERKLVFLGFELVFEIVKSRIQPRFRSVYPFFDSLERTGGGYGDIIAISRSDALDEFQVLLGKVGNLACVVSHDNFRLACNATFSAKGSEAATHFRGSIRSQGVSGAVERLDRVGRKTLTG